MSLLAVQGIYENGQIILNEPVPIQNTYSVIVTFLEEKPKQEKTTLFSSFNFKKAQQLSKHIKTSFSDALIEERREMQ